MQPDPANANAVDPADILLSVIVPCYDEESTVGRIVDRLRALPVATEITCVDDGSTDGTRAKLRKLETEGRIDRLLTHSRNRGKGAAIRTGLAAVTGDVVLIQDADLEYDPADIPSLLQPILDGHADAVLGSRFRSGKPVRALYFWHRVGNYGLTLLSNSVTNLNLTDMETGYKIVRTDLLRKLELTSNRFGFEPEIVARLARAQARIFEVGISYRGRNYEEGKKIGWRDGVAAMFHILHHFFHRRGEAGVAKRLPRFDEVVRLRAGERPDPSAGLIAADAEGMRRRR